MTTEKESPGSEFVVQSNSFSLEKEQENHFHIINYSAKELLQIKFRVSGYVWSTVQIKKPKNIDQGDMEVPIKDIDGNSINIGLRIMHVKAGYQLIFYALTVLINSSSMQLTFFFNTLNRQIVAGQDSRTDFVIANREDSILASI